MSFESFHDLAAVADSSQGSNAEASLEPLSPSPTPEGIQCPLKELMSLIHQVVGPDSYITLLELLHAILAHILWELTPAASTTTKLPSFRTEIAEDPVSSTAVRPPYLSHFFRLRQL